MGDLIQSTCTKVYYVFGCTDRSRQEQLYRNLSGVGTAYPDTLASASRFPLPEKAILELQNRAEAGRGVPFTGISLIRVEETPGVEQRVLLGELEAAPSGATVKYALRHDNKDFLKQNGRDCNFFTSVISDVLLVDTHAAAFAALADVQTGGRYGHIRPTIVRIAIIPGVPTVTETVLS